MANEFTHEIISDQEREEIRKQAKEIMEGFSKRLSNIKDEIKEPLIEREETERVEKQGNESDANFKERMFSNAPNKNKDFILTEKKKW